MLSATHRISSFVTVSAFAALASLAAATLLATSGARADVTLLNVSYDPTRELFQEFNAAFSKHWQATAGEKVTVYNSHGGSRR